MGGPGRGSGQTPRVQPRRGGTGARPRARVACGKGAKPPGRGRGHGLRVQASVPQHRSAQGASGRPCGQHVAFLLRSRTTQEQGNEVQVRPRGSVSLRTTSWAGSLASRLGRAGKAARGSPQAPDGDGAPDQGWWEGSSRRALRGPSLPCPAPSEDTGAVAPWEGGSRFPTEDEPQLPCSWKSCPEWGTRPPPGKTDPNGATIPAGLAD